MTVKNMVFKKCYLLVGVMMAANIFVVNEVKAMNEQREEDLEKVKKFNNDKKIEQTVKNSLPFPLTVSGFILSWENSINFIVGSTLSLANNYFKWWDYNKGVYRKWGCLGWRSGRFANGIFQFDINLNLGRGFSWLIPGWLTFIMPNKTTEKDKFFSCSFYSSFPFYSVVGNANDIVCLFAFVSAFCLQGFLSMPLVIHISTFDFTIALDSLIWCGVGFLSHLGDNTEKEKDKLIEKPIDSV